MLVTVKDATGQLIGSLNKSDFTVYDNGVKQDIAVFDRQTEQPLSVAMLVDTSASTGIELRYELDSVSRFLKVLLTRRQPRRHRGALQLQLGSHAAQRLHAAFRACGSDAEAAQIRRRHVAL